MDGCQSQRPVQWFTDPGDGCERPAVLCWVGAASISLGSTVHLMETRIWLSCSYLDEAWAAGLPGGVPVVVSDYRWGPALRRDITTLVARSRAELEHVVATESQDPSALLIVDGSLQHHRPHERTVGVVKTCATRYLPDERPLMGLEPGWRSGAFTLAAVPAHEHPRLSTYVRLHPPEGADWAHGLVRVEAWSEEDLAVGGGGRFPLEAVPGIV